MPVLAASLLGPVLMLAFAYVTHRYFHEYLLFFAVAGALGAVGLARPGPLRLPLRAAALVLVAGNVVVGLQFAVWYQAHDTNVGRRVPALQARIERSPAFVRTLLAPAFENGRPR